MNKLKLDLKYCYGIKKMKEELDFSNQRVAAIYAPNGSMKSSLAQVFMDLSDGLPSKDRFFPDRTSAWKITDERNLEINKESVLTIKPYDEELKHSEKTSTLLVNNKLRKEYEELHIGINKEKDIFLKGLHELSGSKKNLEKEISSAFTKSDNAFQKALFRIEDEMSRHKSEAFSDIDYDKIFDDKVLAFLGTKNVQVAIKLPPILRTKNREN